MSGWAQLGALLCGPEQADWPGFRAIRWGAAMLQGAELGNTGEYSLPAAASISLL